MLHRVKKNKRPHAEPKSANEKRKMDLVEYDHSLSNMKSLFTGYHKSLNGLLKFYRGFSDELKVFYDNNCSYYEHAEKASNAFATAAKVLSENVSVLLGLEDIIKVWTTTFAPTRPAIKAFDQGLKAKRHYTEKLVRLKADQEVIEAKNVPLSKKKTARILRVEFKNDGSDHWRSFEMKIE